MGCIDRCLATLRTFMTGLKFERVVVVQSSKLRLNMFLIMQAVVFVVQQICTGPNQKLFFTLQKKRKLLTGRSILNNFKGFANPQFQKSIKQLTPKCFTKAFSTLRLFMYLFIYLFIYLRGVGKKENRFRMERFDLFTLCGHKLSVEVPSKGLRLLVQHNANSGEFGWVEQK